MLLQKIYKNSCILKLLDNAIEYGTLQLCCIFCYKLYFEQFLNHFQASNRINKKKIKVPLAIYDSVLYVLTQHTIISEIHTYRIYLLLMKPWSRCIKPFPISFERNPCRNRKIMHLPRWIKFPTCLRNDKVTPKKLITVRIK